MASFNWGNFILKAKAGRFHAFFGGFVKFAEATGCHPPPLTRDSGLRPEDCMRDAASAPKTPPNDTANYGTDQKTTNEVILLTHNQFLTKGRWASR